mgnify:CR=1 FL=1
MDQFLAIAVQILPFVLLIVVCYFVLIRPQRKRDKETQRMRNNLQVGDEIVTVGGVVGLVVSIKEDTVVVETGGDRSKIRIKRWAIQENLTVHDDTAAKSCYSLHTYHMSGQVLYRLSGTGFCNVTKKYDKMKEAFSACRQIKRPICIIY